MQKAEAEKAIRSLSTTWFHVLPDAEKEHLSYSTFKVWLRDNGYSGY